MVALTGWLAIVGKRTDRLDRAYALVYGLGLGLIGDEVGLLLTFGKLLFRVDLSDFRWSSRPDYSRSPGYSIRGEIAKRFHGHGKMGSSGPRWALSSRVLNLFFAFDQDTIGAPFALLGFLAIVWGYLRRRKKVFVHTKG